MKSYRRWMRTEWEITRRTKIVAKNPLNCQLKKKKVLYSKKKKNDAGQQTQKNCGLSKIYLVV